MSASFYITDHAPYKPFKPMARLLCGGAFFVLLTDQTDIITV